MNARNKAVCGTKFADLRPMLFSNAYLCFQAYEVQVTGDCSMNHVQCPHCQHALINDGRLTGQLVACPQCQGQLHMPESVNAIVAADPPQVVVQSRSSSASYSVSGRRKKRRDDPTNLVLGLMGILVLVIAVGFFVFQQSDAKLKESSNSIASANRSRIETALIDSDQDVAEAETVVAETDRRRREEEARAEEERRFAESNARLLRIEDEHRRQSEQIRIDRESRLVALGKRERLEIPPIEAKIDELQNRINTGDRKMAMLRQQMRSMPQSSGIPGGTRFQPSIPREVGDIGRQGIQNWQQIENSAAKIRAELVKKLRVAEELLEQKRSEFDRERQAIIARY